MRESGGLPDGGNEELFMSSPGGEVSTQLTKGWQRYQAVAAKTRSK